MKDLIHIDTLDVGPGHFPATNSCSPTGSVMHKTILSALFALLVLTALGCRSYGGYGTEAQTYEEMQEAVQELENELGPARSDLQQLQAVAERDTALAALAERYQDLVETHEAMIKAQRERVDALSAEAQYRTLNRTYGAFITDQRLLRIQYDRTIRQVYGAVRDTTAPQPPARDPSTYNIEPLGYPKEPPRSDLTMAEALEAAEGTPGLQQEETPES